MITWIREAVSRFRFLSIMIPFLFVFGMVLFHGKIVYIYSNIFAMRLSFWQFRFSNVDDSQIGFTHGIVVIRIDKWTLVMARKY